MDAFHGGNIMKTGEAKRNLQFCSEIIQSAEIQTVEAAK